MPGCREVKKVCEYRKGLLFPNFPLHSHDIDLKGTVYSIFFFQGDYNKNQNLYINFSSLLFGASSLWLFSGLALSLTCASKAPLFKTAL